MQDTAIVATENPLLQKRTALASEYGEKQPEQNPLTRKINPLLRNRLKATLDADKQEQKEGEVAVPVQSEETMPEKAETEGSTSVEKAESEKEETTSSVAEEKRTPLLADPDKAIEIKQSKETNSEEEKEAEPSEAQEIEKKDVEISEPKEEEKPKRRTRKRKTTDEASSSTMSKPDDIKSYEFDTVDIFGTKHTFEEACALATSQFVDEEWLKFRDSINEKVKRISLKDVKPGAVSYIIEEIDCILSEIADPLETNTTLIKIITDSNCGIGTAIRKQAALFGSNAHERDAAGFNALAKAKIGGKDLNLIQLLAAATVRKSFLDSIKERLERKQAMLITIAADNKVQAEMAR